MKFMKPWLLVLVLIAVLVMGADLKESTGNTLLSSTTVAMGTNNTKADLFTVPVGKSCVIRYVIVRSLSGSVALSTDNDFGIGSPAAGWKDTVSMSDVADTDDFYIVTPTDNVRITVMYVAGDVFGIQTDVNSSSGTVNATLDVFGYLF